ncbi:MAG TPA: UbiA family prenyltransferase, partial [Candidatus Acidoferrum sp.]|nr:UbiA family prenyltransferase [Candidatus Acidoferrum sp.]
MVGKQQMPPSATNPPEKVPLCVDLDGTLIKTDVLWESLMLLLKRNPLYLVALPFWLLRGRAFLKQQIAARTELNPATLPYHPAFLDFLREERRRGRKLILTTAADGQVAQRVAHHVGLFSEVIASNGETNLRGGNKGRKLVERFGKQGFDYAGNSRVDLPVWRAARAAIVVNADEGLAQKARQFGEVSHVFNEHKSYIGAFVKELRPHQWVKNLIIFVPLITSHKFDATRLRDAVLAFISFSLCASAVYLLNDLVDLDADRHHHRKKLRPFASGELPLPVGLVSAPLLLALSAG